MSCITAFEMIYKLIWYIYNCYNNCSYFYTHEIDRYLNIEEDSTDHAPPH